MLLERFKIKLASGIPNCLTARTPIVSPDGAATKEPTTARAASATGTKSRLGHRLPRRSVADGLALGRPQDAMLHGLFWSSILVILKMTQDQLSRHGKIGRA
jgi:hypothetical protein